MHVIILHILRRHCKKTLELRRLVTNHDPIPQIHGIGIDGPVLRHHPGNGGNPRIRYIEHGHPEEGHGKFLESLLYQMHFGRNGPRSANGIPSRGVHNGAPHSVRGFVECFRECVVENDLLGLLHVRQHGYPEIVFGGIAQIVDGHVEIEGGGSGAHSGGEGGVVFVVVGESEGDELGDDSVSEFLGVVCRFDFGLDGYQVMIVIVIVVVFVMVFFLF
mmetsp:Transcript_8885/g.17725  ORF Transcript_8885/g.17725 Transcript_8885/m.17725 type:complete len:218 (-) Transcript_8885:59-712(-)